MTQARFKRGVTLVEVTVVMAIMAIMASWAVPAMTQWVRDIRASVLTNAFLADLQLARSEAIRRGSPVVMCARAGQACDTGAGWEQGWLLFADGNDNARLDPEESIIREAAAIPDGWQLRGNTPVARYVSYHALGQTRLVNGGFQAGTLTVCPVSALTAKPRRIVINSHGRPRVETGAHGQGCGPA